ncbi:unnamed protein product (macronuclear) [Paramecium tetraurelia]|uniref:Transmembrane protein n=1 Tax=Paramecium tetraurelia TaxID=5888 RepID=A0BM75_PARTE|nr:uncharacterized protein GSPATT00030276001 [Paramecium tetraurelia]CAK59642.1 unnamed protein product [Paramecium tetraurelia]|eukprot:XP_001427040.1 hypothetical protein (macronuclear) [Paramecium tetraurelia strain d4-2]
MKFQTFIQEIAQIQLENRKLKPNFLQSIYVTKNIPRQSIKNTNYYQFSFNSNKKYPQSSYQKRIQLLEDLRQERSQKQSSNKTEVIKLQNNYPEYIVVILRIYSLFLFVNLHQRIDISIQKQLLQNEILSKKKIF